MSKEIALFEDLIEAVDSWASAAAMCLTNEASDDIWVENRSDFTVLRTALIANGVSEAAVQSALRECLRGVAHSFLCILDGATKLSDTGRLYVVDEAGTPLGEGLHEEFSSYLSTKQRV